MTKPIAMVERAFALHLTGMSQAGIARELRVSRAAVRSWLARGLDCERAARVNSGPCDVATCDSPSAVPPAAYSYLLGLYLGDGCISAVPRGTGTVLRIICCDEYPNLMEQCEAAIRQVAPGRPVYRIAREGCHEIACRDRHWRCLFPQHGDGEKHKRSIALEPWQQAIADQHPHELIRGLIHSDGCRVTNRVRADDRLYAYPRYFFTNLSLDIQRIFTDALDSVGIPWRNNNWHTVSIARREGVAALDEFVGPKS